MHRLTTTTVCIALALSFSTAGCKNAQSGAAGTGAPATCAELVARIQRAQQAMMEMPHWSDHVKGALVMETLAKAAEEAGARPDPEMHARIARDKIMDLAPRQGTVADLARTRPRIVSRCEALPAETMRCLARVNWADWRGRFDEAKGCMEPQRFVQIFIENR